MTRTARGPNDARSFPGDFARDEGEHAGARESDEGGGRWRRMRERKDKSALIALIIIPADVGQKWRTTGAGLVLEFYY